MSNPVLGAGTYLGKKDLRTERIWLESDFRVKLIKYGIDKAGSINKLGRELGYRSRVHPGWSIRQILLGKQAFPYNRLARLADYLGWSMDEILKYQAKRDKVTFESTRRALQEHGMWYYIPR
ncbi:MAG: hypothetical protein QHH00_03535 [Methanomassiliicoccales archaeon]|nr:hypothetical protein [Methanomassiliicoccales archaeon]